MGETGAGRRVEAAEGMETVTTAAKLSDGDIYTAEPAKTPRVRWFDDAEQPIDWSALVLPRAPKSGMRLVGEVNMEEWR